MKSIKINKVEWFYDTDKDLIILNLLKVLDNVYQEVENLKFNENIKNSDFFKSNYIFTKSKSKQRLFNSINQFNTLSRKVFSKTSKPPIISMVDTFKAQEVVYIK
jgi:hypothetical protein